MKLSKFYQLLSAYAKITLKRESEILYYGTVKNIPDEFDGLTVLNFNFVDDGFTFYVK